MSLINLICFLLLLNTCTAEKNTLPVFIIDHDKALDHIPMEPNPFAKVGSAQFVEILRETIKHSDSVIIFVEETFSIEDITQKDKHGSPYLYMQQSVRDKKAQYLPAVVEPYSLLTHMFPPQDYNVFYLKSRKKLELIDTFKYIYIYFKDNINETRIDGLRRHDMIIKEVYTAVRQLKPGPVIVFYTGKSNPTVIEKLRFIPIPPNPTLKDLGVMIESSRALFRFTGVYSASPTRRALFNQLPMISKELWTRRSMTTKMAYTDFELEFNFSFKDYGWILDDVVLLEADEEVGRTEMRIGAPWNMSYFCAEPLVIVNTRDGSLVTISKYKIQPHMRDYHQQTARREESGDPPGDDNPPSPPPEDNKPTSPPSGDDNTPSPNGDGPSNPPESDDGGDKNPFGPSTECAKYFSPGILSGLLVTSVCLAILAYGIVCMMEINTNDRYEDPQSKPMVHPDN